MLLCLSLMFQSSYAAGDSTVPEMGNMEIHQIAQQSSTIKGVVKDQKGEPLIGVNVMEKGTTNGSITDVDGKYSVSVKGGKTILVFSYIGYISQEIPVGNQKTLNVTMKEDTEELEEVVVIGYGTARRRT